MRGEGKREREWLQDQYSEFEWQSCNTNLVQYLIIKINRQAPQMEVKQIQEWQTVKKIQNYMFYLTEKVGEGSFSQVFKGSNINTNQVVAVKKVRTGDVKSKIARRLLQCEVSILPQLNHPCIIRCLDIHFSVNNCYIITEFCDGGNLDLLCKSLHPLAEVQINKIILSIFRALQYLAHLGMVHRDIKLSNVFIQNGSYKLGDFGFAIKAAQCFKDVSIGSPLYMSPEGLIHHIYGPKTDVWAFGILIYEILHGTTPLQNCRSEDELRKKVLQPPPFRSDIPLPLRELIEGCLKISEKQRFSVAQIGESNYIRNLIKQSQADQRVQKEQNATDYTSTAKSQSSNSLTSRYLASETAEALLNYCHLIHKTARFSPSLIFQKCMFWLIRKLSTSLILTSSRERDLDAYAAVRRQSQKLKNQYGFRECQAFRLEDLLAECGRQAQKKMELALQFKLLASQTEYLMKAESVGNLEYFAKKTKGKKYLATFPNCP